MLASPAMTAIRVERLVRRFGTLAAVDGVSFDVREGELFGILGPNGAGKTTLISILSTLLRPTSGRAEVAGFPVVERPDDVRRSIGVVFQEPSLDTRLTARENLALHAAVYGVPKDERRPRIAEMLAMVELEERADSLVETFSGGMRRRLELARGFTHRPKVLFLDEPSLGLDAQTRRRMWEYIERLNREQVTTVILTTHYMEEADRLCGRIAILDRGRIVALDSPERLKATLGGDVVTLGTTGETAGLADHLRAQRWATAVRRFADAVELTTDGGARRIPDIVSAAQDLGVVLTSVNLRTPSLEDVFLHFTGRSIGNGEVDAEARFTRVREWI